MKSVDVNIILATDEGNDFYIELELPNGNVANILIPKDIEYDGGSPYGLNLVFGGHYE